MFTRPTYCLFYFTPTRSLLLLLPSSASLRLSLCLPLSLPHSKHNSIHPKFLVSLQKWVNGNDMIIVLSDTYIEKVFYAFHFMTHNEAMHIKAQMNMREVHECFLNMNAHSRSRIALLVVISLIWASLYIPDFRSNNVDVVVVQFYVQRYNIVRWFWLEMSVRSIYVYWLFLFNYELYTPIILSLAIQRILVRYLYSCFFAHFIRSFFYHALSQSDKHL